MDAARNPRMGRIATAAAIGTIIEFYDFTIFGTAAALVFSKVFFPSLGAAAGTAIAFATFGVAFVIRPFGAIFFGHFGDRVGRKTTLVVTLLLMGAATVCIGLLPSAASIGVWAPILLVVLRCVQGFAMGGEWAGATVVTAESAPEGRRGFWGVFPQLGPSVGFMLSSATFALTFSLISSEEFLAWGWRIPFLASALLVVVGFIARAALVETAHVQVGDGAFRKLPFLELLREQPKELVLATGSTLANFGLFYLAITYVTSYAATTLRLGGTTVLLVGIAGGAALALTTVVSGIWSDRIGRRRSLIIANAACLVSALALFPIIGVGTTAALLVGVVLLQLTIGLAYGPIGSYLPELFAEKHRYTGAGLAYNLATVLGGAMTPLIATQLIGRFGPLSVGFYIASLCAISLVCLLLSKETTASREARQPPGRQEFGSVLTNT